VCLSHTGIVSKPLNIASRKQHHVIAKGLYSFLTRKLFGGRTPNPDICDQSDQPPFKQHNFNQYLLIAPQPSEMAKKVQLALIRSRPRAFQQVIDEPCTLPLTLPKKKHILLFLVSFNFCRKKSATKFLCVKTSSGKVVATSFPYPTVHRSIAGDVPIDKKFALKVIHPFISTDFANSAVATTASKKNSISTNVKSTTHVPSSHR